MYEWRFKRDCDVYFWRRKNHLPMFVEKKMMSFTENDSEIEMEKPYEQYKLNNNNNYYFADKKWRFEIALKCNEKYTEGFQSGTQKINMIIYRNIVHE